jgi:quinohemoprotein ethanol dehydrogenase
MTSGRTRLSSGLLALAWIFTSGPIHAAERNIDDKAINDTANTAEWLAYGHTHDEQRFSPLNDINAENIGKLGVDWYLDLPGDVGLVSTPLVVDGVMYFTGTMNVIRAVDARTGKLIWEYDPEVYKVLEGQQQVMWKDSRGISTYGDKIFSATWDGRLVALDRKTGKLIWETRTFPLGSGLHINGHPKAFKGKVLIGNGGTEVSPNRAYVTAYDAETGKQAWRFHIVPGNPADGFESPAQEMAAKTWTGKWWKLGGGGNVWHGLTYDEEFETVYIGTGNGSPWNRKFRSPEGGDNLFLCSIVALNADTGEYKWHYQTTPGESWDFNSTMDMVLADITIDNKPIKALLHAPKNGFFYVINRETGKLVSAEPFADVNWATHVDLKTGRPVEREGSRYEDGSELVYPTPWGSHSWHAMSYNPNTGLVYLPTQNLQSVFDDTTVPKDWKLEKYSLGTGVGFTMEKIPNRSWGTLQAWDPVKKKAAWKVDQDFPWGSGTLTTAGNLVFQGEPTGLFKAYDAKTGSLVWKYDAGLGISAPAITYKLDGKQMISLLVGFGGGWSSNLTGVADKYGWSYGAQTRRLITFSLDGKAKVPEQPGAAFAQPIIDKDFKVDDAQADAGAAVYGGKTCVLCHGAGAVAAAMAPDLRASPALLDKDGFTSIVRDGAHLKRGMPAFPKLTDDELNALRHYIRREARKAVHTD